jgi:hypothetical protein
VYVPILFADGVILISGSHRVSHHPLQPEQVLTEVAMLLTQGVACVVHATGRATAGRRPQCIAAIMIRVSAMTNRVGGIGPGKPELSRRMAVNIIAKNNFQRAYLAPESAGELRQGQAFLYAFDLLELNGTDLRREPIEVRKATLASCKSWPGVRLNEHLEHDDGEALFRHACKMVWRGSSRRGWDRVTDPGVPRIG